jgi:hypothetical protein
MVEQTQASLPGSLRHPGAAERRPVQAASERTDAEPALTAPWLLLATITCLLIPGNFTLAGAQVSPNRLLLLTLGPLLAWRWLRGDAGRPNAVDLLMIFSTLWAGLALTINHGLSSLPRSLMICAEIFGGYLIGRMLIRNTADYRRFFFLLTCGFAVLLPVALFEMLTGQNLLRSLFGHVFTMAGLEDRGKRLGMTRAMAIFEHPILFGLVGSMAFANVLYIYRDRFWRSVRLAAFFGLIVFTTISSAPMISIGLQLIMTVWDRTLWFMRGKWLVLAGLGVMALVFLRVASEFHLLDFLIQNLMFDPQTASGRIIIIEYASAEIGRHPLFGIGLGEWVRPWYKSRSMDNFWLNHGMRFGLPSLLLLLAAIGVSASRIFSQSTLTAREKDYRTGYLIVLAGLIFILGTVYIWSATAVFVSIYIGAGAMFYMRAPATELDTSVRARRASQARIFDAAAVPVAAMDGRPAAATRAGGPAARTSRARDPRGGRSTPSPAARRRSGEDRNG